MIKNIKPYLFPLLIAFSALSVSASSAFYSVSGLSKLFAGAAFAVIIMAASLEVAKLVIASLLYQYRQTLPKLLKVYLSIACVVLILITSMGIYGFLSSAYQKTATQSGIVENQIKLLETKKTSFEKIKGQYEVEKTSLTENITSLRNALGNNTQSYVDNNGNVISYSSGANRKAFEKQLEVAIQKDEQLTTKIQTFNDSIINLETKIVETQINSEVTSELGPLKYLSNLTGVAMDKIINWLLLVIIFVFDPLAIALVIAANFAFAQLRPKKETLVEDNEGTDIYTEDELSDWDETLMDGLEDEEFDVWGVEDKTKEKLDELEFKYNSLVEYLSNVIEIENQKEDEMKLFNFFKKKEEVIEEPIIETSTDETLQWDEYGNPEPILEPTPEIKPLEKPNIDMNGEGSITIEDLEKVRAILQDPTLPDYKRGYWKNLEKRILKELYPKTDDSDNTITYN